MRYFTREQIDKARAHALEGGQGLHVWTPTDWERGMLEQHKGIPMPFKRTKSWAHLFDQDFARLVATARRLGVNVIVVEKQGAPSQHIDLCGRPLERAIAEAERSAP